MLRLIKIVKPTVINFYYMNFKKSSLNIQNGGRLNVQRLLSNMKRIILCSIDSCRNLINVRFAIC